MTARTYNVLFLCTGNSARSIIAEAILAQTGAGRFRSFSAGSTPTGQVHPFASELLKRVGHDISGFRSKSWDEFAGDGAPAMDFVFTVCGNAANEICPIWPGRPLGAHWGLPDPAAVQGSDDEKRQAFAETYRRMHQRISAFINLPLATSDPDALRKRLQEIGDEREPGQ